jgi:hypothetical protein
MKELRKCSASFLVEWFSAANRSIRSDLFKRYFPLMAMLIRPLILSP